MQHQAWAEGNEDDIAALHLTTKRGNEHEVRVAHGGVHALTRAGDP